MQTIVYVVCAIAAVFAALLGGRVARLHVFRNPLSLQAGFATVAVLAASILGSVLIMTCLVYLKAAHAPMLAAGIWAGFIARFMPMLSSRDSSQPRGENELHERS